MEGHTGSSHLCQQQSQNSNAPGLVQSALQSPGKKLKKKTVLEKSKFFLKILITAACMVMFIQTQPLTYDFIMHKYKNIFDKSEIVKIFGVYLSVTSAQGLGNKFCFIISFLFLSA